MDDIYTLAGTPTQLTAISAYSSGVNLTWNTGTDPGWTYYKIETSTNVNFYPILEDYNSYTSGSGGVYGLNPYTTYYFRAYSINGSYNLGGLHSNYSVWVATPTLMVAPSQIVPSSFTPTSIAWTWPALNGAVTYEAYDESSNLLGTTAISTFTRTALLPNRPYQVSVRGIDFLNRPGDYIYSSSTYTLSNPSSSTAITAATQNSVTLSWWQNGNPPGSFEFSWGCFCWTWVGTQQYQVSYSTSSSFSAPVTTPALVSANGQNQLSYTANGLQAYTTYYFRVRPINFDNKWSGFDGVVSTPTLLPATTSMMTLAVTTQSATWLWTKVSSSTGYNLYSSTTATRIATAVGVTSTAWTVDGLLPNRSYTLSVKPIDFLNREGASFSNSTYTLSNPSSGTVVTAVSNNTVSLVWAQNGNPPGTCCSYFDTQRYEVTYSTYSNFAYIPTTASVSANGQVTQVGYTTPNSLLSGTTYYLRVRAYNNGTNPIYSGYDTVVATVTALPGPSTMSFVNPPGVSSITFVWGLVANAAGYRLYTSTNGLLGMTTDTTWTWYGLLPDRYYQLTVKSVDVLGRDGGSISSATYTAPNPSSSTLVTSANQNSVSLTWWHNGNPGYQFCCYGGGANYQIYSSSNVDFSAPVVTSAVTSSVYSDRVSFTSSSLRSGTTYYFKVRAYTPNNVFSDYDLTVATVTTLPAPASISLTGVGISSISWA
jgi:titin